MRGNRMLETRTVELPPGRSRLRFRTVMPKAGIGTIRVEFVPGYGAGMDSKAGMDRVPENDTAFAATRRASRGRLDRR
ncbi:MAG: hypothetical protein ACJA2W_001422 [Planctomycetota bacterium]|jgi:hypothetical protein